MLPEYPPNIGALPRSLELVRDLEEFEGPILSELRAEESGGLYLEKWCARDADITRTLVVRTEQRALAEYLAGRMTMLDLLLAPSDGIGFIVDRAANDTRAVYVVSLRTLPESYLPARSALHDPSLRPHWEITPQSFLLNPEWDGKVFGTIERRYQNVFAFSFFTAYGNAPTPPADVFTYNFDGGFPIMHMFKRLRGAIPKGSRPRAAGASASSPGVFTIDAPTEIANRVTATIAALGQSASAYDAVYQWSRFKPELVDRVPETALNQLTRLCDTLGVNSAKLLPRDVPATKSALLVAGKLVAAYYRQLWELVAPNSGFEFLGAHLDEAASEPEFLVEEADEDVESWA